MLADANALVNGSLSSSEEGEATPRERRDARCSSSVHLWRYLREPTSSNEEEISGFFILIIVCIYLTVRRKPISRRKPRGERARAKVYALCCTTSLIPSSVSSDRTLDVRLYQRCHVEHHSDSLMVIAVRTSFPPLMILGFHKLTLVWAGGNMCWTTFAISSPVNN